jgi:hypothetical protein
MDWNATPKRSTLASSFLSSSLSPSSPSTQQEASAYFSAAGSCKRRYAETVEDAASAGSSSSGDMHSSNSLFLDCESLQHSLKRVRLSSSPGELRLQRDLRHLVLSSRWIPVDEDLWCLQQSSPSQQQQQQHQPHGDDAAGAPRIVTPPCSNVQLQRLTTATLKMTVILPTKARNNNDIKNRNHIHTTTTLAHVWIQIPRLYPHRPPVVTQITYSEGAIPNTVDAPHANTHYLDHGHGDHQHQHSPESVMLHPDVPTKEWFSGSGENLVDEQQHQQQQQQHSRIHSIVFTNEGESMLAGLPCITTTATTTVYAPWSPIQRLGDALDCIIERLLAAHVNIPHSSSTSVSPSSAGQHTHNHTATTSTTDIDNQNPHNHEDASVARLSRFWHEKETASYSTTSIHSPSHLHTEADRATEIQIHRARSDSNMLGLLHGSDDATNVASFQPNRFDQGYERESPWSSMDVSM